MSLTDIAQVLDLGLTGGLAVAVVALWLDLKETRKQLTDILKQVAGLQAQGVKTMDSKFYVVWLNGSGQKSAQGFSAQGFEEYLKDHPQAYQYHVEVNNCMYSLATIDQRLAGLEYEAVQELIMYIEIPF